MGFIWTHGRWDVGVNRAELDGQQVGKSGGRAGGWMATRVYTQEAESDHSDQGYKAHPGAHVLQTGSLPKVLQPFQTVPPAGEQV